MAEADTNYILIYQTLGQTKKLPNTGDLDQSLLAILGSLGIVGVWVATSKKRHPLAFSVIILTGQVFYSPLKIPWL
ncbi:LPXTG cell wall anchor domain-containing protein [Streptococcus pluranimalium]|uniref:LPXTG cell wall anchor domain-containing protein n=1 Tax=Streptococcus pluranimalium TaxID=82348 RepID=UPI0039FC7B72